jgi:hypothetical protein
MQGTLDPSSGGNVNVGGSIVYVYTQSAEAPVQSVYVHVYVLVPEQTGSAPITGPVGVTGSPQEFMTDGGVGVTWASLMHATVEPSSGGMVNEGGSTV